MSYKGDRRLAGVTQLVSGRARIPLTQTRAGNLCPVSLKQTPLPVGLGLLASLLSTGGINPECSSQGGMKEKGKILTGISLVSSGFDFFEASAKENISVRQAFERLVDAICDKMSDTLDTDPSVLGTSKNTRLSDTPPLLQQNCSC